MKLRIIAFLLATASTLTLTAQTMSAQSASQEVNSILAPLAQRHVQGKIETMLAVWTQGQPGQPCFVKSADSGNGLQNSFLIASVADSSGEVAQMPIANFLYESAPVVKTTVGSKMTYQISGRMTIDGGRQRYTDDTVFDFENGKVRISVGKEPNAASCSFPVTR